MNQQHNSVAQRHSPSGLYAMLWRHGAGKHGMFLLALFFLATGEGFRLVVPWLAAQGIDVLQQHGWRARHEALHWLLAMFACLAAVWLFYGPGRLLERNFALHVRSQHARALLRKLLQAPLSWHETHHTGDLSQRFFASTHALFYFTQEQYQYVQCVVMLVGPVLALTLITPTLGLIALIGYSLIVIGSLRLDRHIAALSQQSNEAEYRYSAGLYDVLANVFTVLALRRAAGVQDLLKHRLTLVFQPLRRLFWWQESKWALIDVAANALWCLLLGVYVWQAQHANNVVAMGTLFMVYQYARQADGVVGQLVSQLAAVTQRRVDVAGQWPIEQAPQTPDVPMESPHWQTLAVEHATLKRQANVTVLNDVSLHLEKGRRYALVGPSGAGKTSLLRVLAGLDTLNQGTVRSQHNGWQPEQLRAMATLVPQHSQMFFGTVRDNLQLGVTSDEALLWSMLNIASAQPLIAAQPERLESLVQEGGSNWSGGERQRLSMARGLLAAQAADLWLLDEPTSNLDPQTERQVFSALMHVARDKCVVVALHRLQLLDEIDVVIVMQSGQIVDVGTRDELLTRCPLFQQLYTAQHTGAGDS